jgi:Ecdysteroid kinase-like family
MRRCLPSSASSIRYRDALEPEFLALVVKLPEVLARSQEDRSSPRTLQHADFRLDNVLFDVKGGTRPMATTLDWQILSIGPGVMDVAYFLSAGLDPSERRRHEADLVRFYHAELTQRGVRNYDWDHCWHDYRRQTLHGILMGVFSALSVARTERGMPEAKVERLKGKIEKLKEEIVRLNAINLEMMKSEDKQISLSDPDARSMATSGKDTGIVGYNVQIAVDTQITSSWLTR